MMVCKQREKESHGDQKDVGDFGDYELLEEIGRGGQGVVYRAHQKSLNRTVALKVIGLGHWATEAHLKRFRREAEAAASLEHPGILPITKWASARLLYFSMKFIAGGQLDEAGRLTPISIREAANDGQGRPRRPLRTATGFCIATSSQEIFYSMVEANRSQRFRSGQIGRDGKQGDPAGGD